ncbi:MAG TPA: hypothetical protein VHY20_11605 [Pirellulales bacterium]|jgi:hypothetical protein|nr:hypothetical protein [Pirellulales bacterium]
MNAFSLLQSLFAPAVVLLTATTTLAQNAPPAPARATPAATTPRFRKLAPGVEKTIPAERAAAEELSVHALNELLTIDPNYGERPGTEGQSPAKNVRVPHDNWALEFTFKPLRFMRVDVPGSQGKLVSKLIWYLVYHVRNSAKGEAAKSVRFIPVFWLQSGETGQLYPDKQIAVAIPPIERREDPNRRLLSSTAIEGEIAPGKEAWGVVMWDDIDPAIDRFSILVQGLSGAYQWKNRGPANAPQRDIKLKTLQLNFWRPGDAFYEHESEIRYGAPGDVDYRWVYR